MNKIDPKKKKAKAKIWMIASSVAAVVLLFLYIGFNPKYTKGELYSSYYSVPDYEHVPTRGESSLTSEQEEQVKFAFNYYEKGNFK